MASEVTPTGGSTGEAEHLPPPVDHSSPWALIMRPGAIGDVLMATSVLPGIRRQGYRIAFLCKMRTKEVLKNNPYIDRLIVMPDDFEPKSWLEFMKEQESFYDRVINLFSSIENMLVMRPETIQYWWEPMALRAICNVNYLERTHEIVGVPPPYRPQFWSTQAEDDAAQAFVDTYRPRKIVAVPVAGSAIDKISPHLGEVVVKIVRETGAYVFLMGEASPRDRDLILQILADAQKWGDVSRVKHTLERPLRWSMALAQHVDVVLGPDTGMMWSVAMNPDVAKVVMLSHATPENITKHWLRTTTLTGDAGKAPCWPCHRIHLEFDHCLPHQPTKTAMCMASMKPGDIVKAVTDYLE